MITTKTLTCWRRRQIKITCIRSSAKYCFIVFTKDKPLHNSPDDVMKEIMCPLAEEYVIPKWKYV